MKYFRHSVAVSNSLASQPSGEMAAPATVNISELQLLETQVRVHAALQLCKNSHQPRTPVCFIIDPACYLLAAVDDVGVLALAFSTMWWTLCALPYGCTCWSTSSCWSCGWHCNCAAACHCSQRCLRLPALASWANCDGQTNLFAGTICSCSLALVGV